MTDDDIGDKPNDDTLHRKLILYVVTDANDDVLGGVGGGSRKYPGVPGHELVVKSRKSRNLRDPSI